MFECLVADIESLTDSELPGHVLALEALRQRVDVAQVRAAGRCDARQVWAADGAVSGTAWFRHQTAMPARVARGRLRVAVQLRSMPATWAAFEAGTIRIEHVEAFCRTRTDANAPVFDRDEEILVTYAAEFDVDEFSRVLRYWRACADAAGFSDDAEAKVTARKGAVSETLDGMVKVDAWLDPESGGLFKAIFDEIDDEFYRADRRDWDRDGIMPRTTAQRRADVFVELARRAALWTDENDPHAATGNADDLEPHTANTTTTANGTGNGNGTANEYATVDSPSGASRTEDGGTEDGRTDDTRTDASQTDDSGLETGSGLETDGEIETASATEADAGAGFCSDSEATSGADSTGHGEANRRSCSDPSADLGAGSTADVGSDPTTDLGSDLGVDRGPGSDIVSGTASGTGADGNPDGTAGLVDGSGTDAGSLPDGGRAPDHGTGGTGTGPVPCSCSGNGSNARSGTRRGGAGRRRPAMNISVDLATLAAKSGGIAYLENGAVISGDAARRLACDADVSRIITSGRSEILDAGRRTPTVSPAQRRAITIRDRTCVFPSCDRPPNRCEAHHLIPFARGSDTGGPTDVDNLALLCPRHHHLVHEGGFTMRHNPATGQIETRRPDGTLLATRPKTTPLNPTGRPSNAPALLPFDPPTPTPDDLVETLIRFDSSSGGGHQGRGHHHRDTASQARRLALLEHRRTEIRLEAGW